MNNIDIFTNIYENNIWGNDSSIDNLYKGTSGGGSEINNCRQYIDFVREFIIKNKINKVIDLGCGDWQASYLIYEKLDNIYYYGYDAYEKLIISSIIFGTRFKVNVKTEAPSINIFDSISFPFSSKSSTQPEFGI